MACLSERIVGAIFSLLSGYALAGGPAVDPPEEMTIANIAPMPMNMAPSIPEPQSYVNHYVMEYQPAQAHQSFASMENFYGVPVTQDFRFGTSAAALAPGARPSQTSSYLGPSTAPQLSLVQLSNATLTLGAQPQRRLSLTLDDWVFSATARIAILHSHDTGATLSVRHGF
jgi:hypothetical protein